MKKTNADKTKFYKRIAILLSVVLVLSAGLFCLRMWERGSSEFPSINANEQYYKYDGKKYKPKSDIETFLVLGLDKFEDEEEENLYNNDKQADFLMLFVFDNSKKTYSVVQINRDTMARVNVLGVAGNRIDTVNKQIALAHTYGNGKEISCRNTMDAVSDLLLGMKINHYMSLTMDAVPIYNDLLGGVEVEILDDFAGIDDALVKGKKVTLNGEQALTYVRARQGLEDSSNNARMQRQRQYLTALREKTLSRIEKDDEFLVEATVKIAEYIVSDRSVTQLQEILRKLSDYEYIETDLIEGETKEGERFMEFYPDRESVEKCVIELFYELKD